MGQRYGIILPNPGSDGNHAEKHEKKGCEQTIARRESLYLYDCIETTYRSHMAEESKSIISLREYLQKGKTFHIPDYQRGYIWGKKNPKYRLNSVEHLLQSLDGVIGPEEKDLYLQGVTVIEQKERIIVIDGQQRTTCLYIILKMLGYEDHFTIEYAIRKESDKELKEITPAYECAEKEDEEYQDIYFFKKTARLVRKHFEGKEDQFETIRNRILDHVRFLYINIEDPQQQAVIFAMMNGNKAVMKDEEIIKADLLRIASLTPKRHASDSDVSNEYENDILRSRYAREWDKWLYWWNREDVAQLFETGHRMLGWLLPIYYCRKKKIALTPESCEPGYERFRDAALSKEDFKAAKDVFGQLRRLQKRFEDVYNDPVSYNYVGAVMKMCEKPQRLAFLQWYFQQDDDMLRQEKTAGLQRYYKWCFLGHTHKEIEEEHFQTNKYDETANTLLKDFVYTEPKTSAYYVAANWLLMQNIDRDCSQGMTGRKFDFAIWENKSLEHILPKSRVSHADPNDPRIRLGGDNHEHPADSYLCQREQFPNGITEHSIGNLVLLYGRDNSAFGNLEFQDKKEKFFSLDDENVFKSRHLIHTISVFANSEWNIDAIVRNQEQTRHNLEQYYAAYFPKTGMTDE